MDVSKIQVYGSDRLGFREVFLLDKKRDKKSILEMLQHFISTQYRFGGDEVKGASSVFWSLFEREQFLSA